MKITINYNGSSETYTLEDHITPQRSVIWIGGHDDAVYNTITIEGADTFQCSISFDKETAKWIASNGQVRTECPRGLKSDRSKACSVCRGCCVNIRIANPIYSLRTPQHPTLVNGKSLPNEGIILNESDIITIKTELPEYEKFCKDHTNLQFDDQGYVICRN